MAYIINSGIPYDIGSGYSTFLPCCNAPITVDAVYQPQHFQEVYYAPEPAPQIQVVRQRLPDPPPDIIERVVVVPQPKKYVYQVVEVPTKPPPVIQERVVHEPPNPTLCGGTYRVQVPYSTGGAPRLAQSSSGIQVPPGYAQAAPAYVQAAPQYIQATPSYGQQAPLIYSSASIMPF
jgi:hypothetical protein